MKDFLKVSRLENLTDGVYAIAMTLLVLSIDIPVIEGPLTPAKLGGALGRMEPLFFGYAISFYILASLWVVHTQQFSVLAHVDRGFAWINLLGLFLICLVPFSTDLVGDFSGIWVADAFFHLHMLGIGACFYWQTSYAQARALITSGISDEGELAREKRLSLALPIAALLGLGLTPLAPGYSCLAYISIPLLLKKLLQGRDPGANGT